ncbi:MAG: type II secretion system protein GspM [Desulfosalsimonadaceae bacterium]
MNININRRERLFLAGAAIFIVFFAFFHLAIAPVFEKRSALASELAAKRVMAAEMQSLRNEYLFLVERIEDAQARYAQRPENFSLFTFLEREAGTSGVKNQITYMRPGSTVDEFTGLTLAQVEMRLQDITVEDLAAFLFQVENASQMIQVSRLSITKSGEQEGPVNVVMRVESAEEAS